MTKQNKHDISQPDVFDVLSASWVMACNDENPILIYDDILHRMDLNSEYRIRELIQSRGDLFRRGVPEKRLEELKERLGQRDDPPNWDIKNLTINDVFRSQFRVGENAPKATLEVIDWGLQHIDRLRKASFEAKDTSVKSWQMWLVFGASLLNIAATIISALLTKS